MYMALIKQNRSPNKIEILESHTHPVTSHLGIKLQDKAFTPAM